MILIFSVISSVVCQSAILADQYSTLLRFMSEGMGRTLQLNQSACPVSISPPNGRVACDFKGRITQLYLVRANLAGNLTSTISSLTDLTYLNLSDNMIVGGVANLAALTNLETLDLSYNAMTGDALASVESMPYLKTCVLQSPSPRDTNCFAGRLEANATVCNDGRVNPLNLCKSYFARSLTTAKAVATQTPTTSLSPKQIATTTTKQPTTLTTTTVTTATEITTIPLVAETPSTAGSSSTKSATSTESTATSTTTTVETPSLTTTGSQSNLYQIANTPEPASPPTDQHLAVVILSVVVALLYIAAVFYVIVSKLRKRRQMANMERMSTGPFLLASDILEVADIVSEDGDGPSSSGQQIRADPIYDRVIPMANGQTGEYSNLNVNSKDLPGAVSPSLRHRNGAAAATVLPPPYSQLPPPITDRKDSPAAAGSYSKIRTKGGSNYNAAASAKTNYDSATSAFN